MNLRRIVGFLVLALDHLLHHHPARRPPPTSVQSIGATLRDAAESITTFFTELV